MTISRRLRLSLLVATAAFTAVALTFWSPAPTAQAFMIQYHESITRAALPGDQVSESAMLQILIGPPPGLGAVGSDAGVTDDFRHLDNATNPSQVCALAQEAWNTFSPVLLAGSQQVGADLADGPAARAAFGGLLHTQQDFYAHTSWVDTEGNQLAAGIFPNCDPGAYPASLHTGYFDIQFGTEGCPPGGPPAGFQACHSTLNKDAPDTQDGAQLAPGTDMTKFEVASGLATTASTNLYTQMRALVASTNGESAAVLLFGGGGEGPSTADAAYTGPGK
jgi:hypothetical protein